MEPGPELDALIAEKVMGWEVRTWLHPAMPPLEPVILATNDDGDCVHIRDLPIVPLSMIWSPSTDIRAAWEVVEKVGVGEMAVVRRPDDWEGGKMMVQFLDSGGSVYAAGEGESAPHAICLAALKAVE